MKPSIFFFACSCLLLFAGCDAFRYKYSIEELLSFLEKEYHYKAPNGLQILVLIPSTDSKDRVFLDYRKFTRDERNRIQLISCLPSDHFEGFPNFYDDKNNRLIQVKILRHKNFILVFRDRELIKAITTPGLEQELYKEMRLYEDCLYRKRLSEELFLR